MSDLHDFVDAMLASDNPNLISEGIVTMLRAESMGFMTQRETHVRLPFTHLHGEDCECRQ